MVSEHQMGLRFDIYERVHLSEGALGIKELDEVELVPHIQVLSQGEQAVLRGNLLLSGKYVDEQNGAGRTLEHLIPVEITLPMNRVGRVEDISVDIENFDVDLLSTRSLNVTGVLSLNGLEIAPAEPQSWREPEEEIVFVHQAEEAPFTAEETVAEAEPADLFRAGREEAQTHVSPAPEPVVQLAADEQETAQVSAAAEPEQAEEEEAAAVFAQEEQEAESEPVAAQPAAEVPEKKELKIAFSGKADPAEEDPVKTHGFKTLIHNAQSSLGNAPRPPEQPEPRPAAPSSDALEWKKLFLSSVPDQREFKKLRLVIVQKEQTLEEIAGKYNMSPREIALFNRLGEQEVKPGQIVYLPR
ncbi:LysM peptidoglycan-binding domain-containing protein [Paenibacillus hamazuiensis]|uniref:LysM peptidoglycan-binding domain-containing protein n=1 Tax=Paenibacillus hamazuiensis TaxID=2936508 RepID=UPI0020108EDE|nr:LysM peptidoglycan-binding domain-containing protein [Paenibacillus hamazuiensis]